MATKVLDGTHRLLAASLLFLLVSATVFSAKPLSKPAAKEKAEPKSSAQTVTSTDIEIFTVILSTWINGEQSIVVQTETDIRAISDAQKSNYVLKRLKDLKLSKDEMSAMLAGLAKRNIKPATIPQIGPKDRIMLRSKQELDTIFKNGFWPEFDRTFPDSGGLVKLSLPVYSKDGKLALIYRSKSTDGRAGCGWLNIFEKVDGEWKSIWTLILWRS